MGLLSIQTFHNKDIKGFNLILIHKILRNERMQGSNGSVIKAYPCPYTTNVTII